MNPRDEAILTYCVKRALDTTNPENALHYLLVEEFELEPDNVRVRRGPGRGGSCTFYINLGREVLEVHCEPRYEYQRPVASADFSRDTPWARDYFIERELKWSVDVREARAYRPPRTAPVPPKKCACGADLPTYATRCVICINLEAERHAIEKAQRDRVEKVKNSVDILYRLCLVAGYFLWLGIDDTSKRFMMLDFEPSKFVATETCEPLVLEL